MSSAFAAWWRASRRSTPSASEGEPLSADTLLESCHKAAMILAEAQDKMCALELSRTGDDDTGHKNPYARCQLQSRSIRPRVRARNPMLQTASLQ